MSMTIKQAEAALASAKAASLEESRQDCERSEGSGAQERRRDERQEALREAVYQCERDLEDAKRRHAVHEDMPTQDQVIAAFDSFGDAFVQPMALRARLGQQDFNPSSVVDAINAVLSSGGLKQTESGSLGKTL